MDSQEHLAFQVRQDTMGEKEKLEVQEDQATQDPLAGVERKVTEATEDHLDHLFEETIQEPHHEATLATLDLQDSLALEETKDSQDYLVPVACQDCEVSQDLRKGDLEILGFQVHLAGRDDQDQRARAAYLVSLEHRVKRVMKVRPVLLGSLVKLASLVQKVSLVQG